ncbi:perlucin-like protein [Lutzomyia longipalpis]|uniref:perlucin-like protein n=1 Tax=Lutzomyia longipalpis TaxID=7200 RepID=UPI0024843962|nr:perlucin-like protein [Lutzomyia longipalpis]
MKFLILCAFSIVLVQLGACTKFNAQKIGDRTVFLNMDEKENWADALESCKRYNLTLVSILSAKEQRELNNVVPGNPDVWIGGYKRDKVWRWINDGEPMSYTSWSAGEPNSLEDDNENCVHLTSWDEGNWNDVRCSDRNFYICEFVKPPGSLLQKAEDLYKTVSQYYRSKY